jgi:hypothetical protein
MCWVIAVFDRSDVQRRFIESQVKQIAAMVAVPLKPSVEMACSTVSIPEVRFFAACIKASGGTEAVLRIFVKSPPSNLPVQALRISLTRDGCGSRFALANSSARPQLISPKGLKLIGKLL